MYFGFVVTSYLIGFVLAITIEIPFCSLEQFFYDPNGDGDNTKRQYRLPCAVLRDEFRYQRHAIVDDSQLVNPGSDVPDDQSLYQHDVVADDEIAGPSHRN